MRILLGSAIVAILLLPLGSCGYFWLIEYPEEVQRATHGRYSIVVEARPTSPILAVELIFGSLHNNTTLDVSLYRGTKQLSRQTLVWGEDLPEDHLPVDVAWSDSGVTVTEPQRGESVSFAFPDGGT